MTTMKIQLRAPSAIALAVLMMSCVRTGARQPVDAELALSDSAPLLCAPAQFASPDTASADPRLPFPGMLEREALLRGNPLATYAAMRQREPAYLKSPVFRAIYPEIRLGFEQFLGLPCAGLQAMDRMAPAAQTADSASLEAYSAVPAVDVIARAAERTRIVIIAEEHHLPQTRSLFEPLLSALHRRGYRYLAAEAFEDADVSALREPDYQTGYYIRDPVFASAIRTALDLGYRLVSYDTREQRADSPSFRDVRQAENIIARTLATDTAARVLVIAGRLHAAEVPAPDGWTPMGHVLKTLTGIDPFTVYTPTMTARLRPETEHPAYRAATARGLVRQPVILVHRTNATLLGTTAFDAYAFFPRPRLLHGRPDWLVTTLHRMPVEVPDALVPSQGVRLIQAFPAGSDPSSIPSDQILVETGAAVPRLMLKAGSYRLRGVGARGDTTAWMPVRVPGRSER